jgi:hypothetical protein
MRVSELIDILSDQPADLEVELVFIPPFDEDSEDITVDRYSIAGVLPWQDEDTGEHVVWLFCGDDEDVDDFIDVLEGDEDDDDHEGHDPA